jgi:murein DD-endopeptidase MepM/ murein hydrolase activator NlpD
MHRKSLFLTGLVSLILTAAAPAIGGTKFRCPLSSCPTPSAWMDHNRAAGDSNRLRYDGLTSFAYDNHDGTDFPKAKGSSIYAAAAGKIYYVKSTCPEDGTQPTCGGSFGNHVRMEHSDGLVTIYAHMGKNTPEALGSYPCGNRVGAVGLSGKTDGYHLHFGLWSDTSKTKLLDFYGGSANGNKSYWVTFNSPGTRCQ